MTSPATQKELGAYYTPDAVAGCLVQWATRSESDRLIDPSCGDGRFIAQHRLSIGVEWTKGARLDLRIKGARLNLIVANSSPANCIALFRAIARITFFGAQRK